MTGWSVTTTFAQATVRAGSGLHAGASQSGFPPADQLLDIIVAAEAADLGDLVWHGPVGMEQVIGEFVSRGWWERAPGPRWRRRSRYRPTNLISAGVRDPNAEQLVRLMLMLFDGSVDTDDIEAEAADGQFGTATWLVHPVLHHLVELRLWLRALATTPPSSG